MKHTVVMSQEWPEVFLNSSFCQIYKMLFLCFRQKMVLLRTILNHILLGEICNINTVNRYKKQVNCSTKSSTITTVSQENVKELFKNLSFQFSCPVLYIIFLFSVFDSEYFFPLSVTSCLIPCIYISTY